MNAHNTFAAPQVIQPAAFTGASSPGAGRGADAGVSLPAKAVVVLSIRRREPGPHLTGAA